MRKLFWLFMMLLLAACGGGGGTTANTPAAGKGTLSLELIQAPRSQAAAKMVANLPTTEPGRYRVVLNEINTHYRAVVDGAVGETVAPVVLPVGTYTVEAVYYEGGTPNVLMQYGKSASNAVIANGANTISAVTLADVAVTMTTPASTVSGEVYTVGVIPAADLAAKGLQDAWSLTSRTTAFPGRQHLAATPSTTHTGLVAPAVSQATSNLYFQAEFFMKSDLLKAGESASNWAFFKEASASLSVPTVTASVSVDLTDTQKPVVKAFSVPGTKVGTTGPVAGISIYATDNGGVKDYAITTSTDPDPASAPAPTVWTTNPVFDYQGTLDNTDRTVYLFAWARDFKNNESVQVAGVTNQKIVFNNSPAITNFVAPYTVQMDSNAIPVTIQGKGYVGGTLECAISESPTFPASATWHTMDTVNGTTSATFDYDSGITQVAGGRYNVPLYAWIRDAAGHSPSAARSVVVSDSPQITVLTATGAATGNIASINQLEYVVKSGRTIAGYAVTTTSAKPAATAFTTGLPTLPLEFDFTGSIISTNPTTRALYVWLKDTEGAISSQRGVSVTLAAPTVTP
ncbi:hypothetical protein [Geomonas subterranea]|uniref:Ig-like domain-containing protein n=1 Tax=Geomonas subterranea TaxID=2847989 RepID=A0ABX8LRG7_9BACT|nr:MULTISPECIES: hypothetical protein [Geomonas]QXE92874.1 hypothetical protein KP001_10310 [Geomonas subterranea]QXM09021.1 hypothetical protein KP002_18965 [Geomonas subterranea]